MLLRNNTRIAFLLLFITLTSSLLANQDLRKEKHDKAINEFFDLNFVYNGKGMVISPNLIDLYPILRKLNIGTGEFGLLNERWGFNIVNKKAVGIFEVPYKKMNLGALGCVACHSGKAAGEFIIGLGNKNIDVYQVGVDTNKVQKIWNKLPRIPNPDFKEIHESAMHFTKILGDKNFSNLTQGLVPTALIKSWFYEITNTKMPHNFGRGQVKVPHLWGYGQKRKTGSFWDGFARGDLPGWAVAVELRGGQTVENVREYIDKVHHAEDVLADFLPPKYPFKINTNLAIKGKDLFSNKCSKCHGSYERDQEGHPIYKSPKLIPIEVVKTDQERLDFVTPDFLKLVDVAPLNDIMQYIPNIKKGYVAPRLWGIWSRFPYLHNASVPTLMDLLSPASERPKLFDLYKSGEKERFDEEKLGLKVERDQNSLVYKNLIEETKKGSRSIYDITKMGQNNIGHEYSFYKTLTHEDKLAIIEFLKTL